jgi:hypothetical protein
LTTSVPTIAVFPEGGLTQSQKIEKWVWHLCRSLEQNYELRYPNSSVPVTFSMELGRKYWKINQNGGGVHAFVDKKTGEVYKPASWRGPAKIVRYDLRIIKDREQLHNPYHTDWAGGYLYLRG